MRRPLILLVAVMLGAGCGTGAGTSTGDGEAVAAPQFTLDLGDGGTFSLEEETRPVFMVFWAEW